MTWEVRVKKKQLKNLNKLPVNVKDDFMFLQRALEVDGPEQPTWQNYSKLSGNKYHCHLNYHYVACWTAEKETITIEVYYVGSREKAPY
jgi:mRNA-degrading endonuclease RelE of RelBE toxin-antitoxin system